MNVFASLPNAPGGAGPKLAIGRPVMLAFVVGAVFSAAVFLGRDHFHGVSASEAAGSAGAMVSRGFEAVSAADREIVEVARRDGERLTRAPVATARARARAQLEHMLSKRPDLLSAPEAWTYEATSASR